jgi:putative membrane protein
MNPEDFYLWAKAIHVIAVISWMAGMLYLPRLFVYHSETVPRSEQSESFKIMERRLLRLIINPAMVVTWAFGIYLAWEGFGFAAGWLHVKILLVLVLSGLHGYFAKAVRIFAQDQNSRSARHWRMMNEMPAILMMLIVILVIVKPF